jgi:hypothetical protein
MNTSIPCIQEAFYFYTDLVCGLAWPARDIVCERVPIVLLPGVDKNVSFFFRLILHSGGRLAYFWPMRAMMSVHGVLTSGKLQQLET